MKQLILLLCLLWGLGNNSYTQTNIQTIAPKTLIPYNDHGKWGYCDTLGHIQIRPAYAKAGFFATHKIEMERQWLGEVQTKWGENLLTTSGELLLPKKLDVIMPIQEEDGRENLFLVRRKGKYGIYALDADELVVKTVYDSLLWRKGRSENLLLKRKEETTYAQLDQTERCMNATPVIAAAWYWTGRDRVEVRKWEDGSYREWQEGQWRTIKPERLAGYIVLDEIWEDQAVEEEYNLHYWQKDRPTAEEMGVDSILEYRDYGSLSFARKYGFTKLMVVVKNGQMGMLDEAGNEILPIAYDNIRLDEQSRSARLEKNGKLGCKMVFTHYPTIEARYDNIQSDRRIRVSRQWSFALFAVEIDGKRGYIGENAVEYFDFE